MKESKQRSISRNKEEEARAKEMLEVPLEWNEVPDLMMEEEDILSKATGSTKIEKRCNLQRAEKTSEGRQLLARETGTFAHSISENTKSRGILF